MEGPLPTQAPPQCEERTLEVLLVKLDVSGIAHCEEGPGPDQSPPHGTKCNSPHINGQCTNFILFDVAL